MKHLVGLNDQVLRDSSNGGFYILNNYPVGRILVFLFLLAWCFPWIIAVIGLWFFGKKRNKEVGNRSIIKRWAIRLIISLPIIMWAVPLIAGTIFAGFIFFQRSLLMKMVENSQGLLFLSFVFLFLFLIGTANLLFLAYLYRSPNVPSGEKGIWARKIAFSQITAIPRFWYTFMWKVYR